MPLLAPLALVALTGAPAHAGDAYVLPTADDPVHLILHDPTGRPAPSEACDVDLCRSLLAAIDEADETIDFAVYGLRGQPAIHDALVRAKARGVTVRGVIDRTLDGENYYGGTEALVAALGTVRDDLAADRRTAAKKEPYDPEGNRCWRDAPEGFVGPKQCVGYDLGDRCILAVQASREALEFQGDIMHDKYFVIDGTWVWLGSTNVSDSGTGGYNANLVTLVHSPTVARWYTADFEQMYGGEHHGEKSKLGPLKASLAEGLSVEALFSPADKPITTAVRPLLQAAKERIDVGIFFLTHKGITADLIAAHRRGVKVRVVMDATAAKNGYAKHELVRAAGIPLKIEAWGGKMHMKAAAIDGKHVITGSMNWTSAGEWGNDENTLVLHSPKHAQQFHDFYDAMWDGLGDRWLTGRPDPESRDSGTSCTDGSDNDFDHLDDAGDPGCGTNPPPLPALPPFSIVPKEEGQGLVKGNVNREGKRTYFTPVDAYYDKVVVDPALGEALFCSEEDARAAGFRGMSR